MEILVAVQILNALISTASNGLLAAQKFSLIIDTARREGRDITKEELDALKAESDAATKALLEAL